MTFKPGQSGNPGGRPKQDPELQKLRALTREKLKEFIELILLGTTEQVDQIKTNPDTPVLTKTLIYAIEKIQDRGDVHSLNVLLERVIGKVKDEVEVTHIEPVVIHRPGGRGTTELTTKDGNNEDPDQTGA